MTNDKWDVIETNREVPTIPEQASGPGNLKNFHIIIRSLD